MTDTSAEVRNLTHLEFDIPCDSRLHDGAESPSAEWIVHALPTLPCGCPVRSQVRLWCDGCLQYEMRGQKKCNYCSRLNDWYRTVTRYERIVR